MQLAQVSYINMLLQLDLELINQGARRCRYRAVVYMNDNNGERLASALVEHGLVYLTTAETEAVNEDCGEFLVPSSSCLFQTIKGPAEAQDSCSKVLWRIPWGWFHVYDLSSGQVTVQVSPLDVDLVEFHVVSVRNGEDGLD